MRELTWQDIEDLIDVVGDAIIEDAFIPSLIVAVPRGGFIPARLLADKLEVKNLMSMPEGLQAESRPCSKDVPCPKILVVDEIADSGKTLQAINHLRPWWRIATLHTRIYSNFQPHYTAVIISSKAWIKYPWERYEEAPKKR